MKRCINACVQCHWFETYGTPPQSSTNYLCRGTDAFRIETKKAYEEKEVPDDCPYQSLLSLLQTEEKI